jgi:hypothetical protein
VLLPIGKHFIHSQQNLKVQIDIAKYSSSQLSNYLADINSIDGKDLESLEALSEQFPYCQIIQSLIVKASINDSNFEDNLEKAAIYSSSRSIIYKLIHHTELFVNRITEMVAQPVENDNVIFSGEMLTDKESIENEHKKIDDQQIIIEETDIEEYIIDIDNSENEIYLSTIAEIQVTKVLDLPEIETYDHHDSVLIKDIEVEAISDSNHQHLTLDSLPIAQSSMTVAHSPKPSSEPSLYNDDTLPFSFLWWLNKTRKEHYENNQPYKNSGVNPIQKVVEMDKSQSQLAVQSEQLNHQIAESVLQLSILDDYKNNEPQVNLGTKEDHIITNFITQEPQIKPLPADKIDTENKAKKSSADTGELVSETLAKIYVEQMLYVKALDTYKKLSLKYPEKSTYFASQIKYLELKVN